MTIASLPPEPTEQLLRQAFMPCIPELDRAVDLLDQAADAILKAELDRARELIRYADIPAVFEFAARIMGPTDPAIHGAPPKRLPPATPSGARMPTAKVQNEIFARDGWRCRFCGTRVISRDARKAINRVIPGAINWPNRSAGRHAAFFALEVSLDHLLPYSRGGDNDPSNLVGACQCCQFGRNQWTIDEVGISDPRLRPPVVDRWDGLTRLLKMR